MKQEFLEVAGIYVCGLNFFSPLLKTTNNCECVSDAWHIHGEKGSVFYFSAETLTGRVSDIPPLGLLQGAEAAGLVSW